MTAPISNEYIDRTADKSSLTEIGNNQIRMRKNVKISSEKSFDSEKSLESQEEEDEPKRSVIKIIIMLFACACAGFVFGWSLEKSRVFEPNSIRQQMIFKKWIMLKVFLTAVASGQLCLITLSLIPWTKEKFENSLKAYYCGFEKKSIITSAIGAFVLGSGMTLCGACPGMVLPQVGTWTGNAYMTFIGALVGALFYGLFAPWIVKFTKPKNPLKYQLVHEQFKINYVFLALPMAILLAITVGLMETFIPWKDDLDKPNEDANIFRLRAWPPFVCGILIGLLQIVLVLFVTDTMGGSSSYVTIVSQWVVTEKLQKTFPYLASARLGVANWWQVFYVCSAVLGALASAGASDTLSSTPGVHKAAAFFGGFIMLIGARFASGCTSGHGLSGMGVLAWLSFIAVPFMFGGGIATAFIFKACDIITPDKLN